MKKFCIYHNFNKLKSDLLWVCTACRDIDTNFFVGFFQGVERGFFVLYDFILSARIELGNDVTSLGCKPGILIYTGEAEMTK